MALLFLLLFGGLADFDPELRPEESPKHSTSGQDDREQIDIQLNELMLDHHAELGDDATAQGRYAEAEEHYRLALELAEEMLEPVDSRLALLLNSFGGSKLKQGRHEEAEKNLTRALEIAEQTDDGKPHTRTILENLARLYVVQGRDAEAEEALQRSLATGNDAP